MDWKDTIAKVTSAAPLLGSFFGAPGTAIGGIVKLVASALGVEPSEEAIAAEIQQNPEALLKLKELESTHRIELEKLLLEKERIRLQDVQNARQRQTETEKSTGKRDMNLYVLAWFGVLGYLALIIYLIAFGLPKMTVELALMVGNLIGIVGGKYSSIYDYFFGSSQGSAHKTATIDTMMEKKGN